MIGTNSFAPALMIANSKPECKNADLGIQPMIIHSSQRNALAAAPSVSLPTVRDPASLTLQSSLPLPMSVNATSGRTNVQPNIDVPPALGTYGSLFPHICVAFSQRLCRIAQPLTRRLLTGPDQ